MALSKWQTSAEIKFSAPGADKLFKDLASETKKLDEKLKAITIKAEAAWAAINGMGKSAGGAAAGIDDLNRATGANAAATDKALTAIRRAAAGYKEMAGSVNEVSDAVRRLNGMMASGMLNRFGLMPSGPRALNAAPSYARVISATSRNFALPAGMQVPYRQGIRGELPAPAKQFMLGPGVGRTVGAGDPNWRAYTADPNWRPGVGGLPRQGPAALGPGVPGTPSYNLAGGGIAAQGGASTMMPPAPWGARGGSGGGGTPPGGAGSSPAGSGGPGWASRLRGIITPRTIGIFPPKIAIPGYFKYLAESEAIWAGIRSVKESFSQSADLQTILQTTANVAGLDMNDRKMSALRQQVFDVGNDQGMSAVDTADMFREIVRNTKGTMPFNDMRGLLPFMAKYQTVIGAARGLTPKQSVDPALGLIHLFRQYSPKGMQGMFDTMLRMNEMMPTDPSAALRQMTYFEPIFKSLGIKDNDAATMMVIASRFGLGSGKGGTSLANLVGNSIPALQMTQHAQTGKQMLLGPKALNLTDAKGQSRFWHDGQPGDIFGFIDQLVKDSEKFGPQRTMQMMKGALGQTALRIGELFTDPALAGIVRATEKAMKDNPNLGLQHQVNTLYTTAGFQEKRVAGNWDSLLTEIGTVAMPAVTKASKDLADALHYAQHWMNSHKSAVKATSDFLLRSVKGVEGFLVAHKGDFGAVGGMFVSLGKLFVTISPALTTILDAVMRLTGAATTLVKRLADIANDVLGFNDAIGKVSRALSDAINKLSIFAGKIDPHNPFGNGNNPLVGGNPRPHSVGGDGSGYGRPQDVDKLGQSLLRAAGDHVFGPILRGLQGQDQANPRYHRTRVRATSPIIIYNNNTIKIDGSKDVHAVKHAVKTALLEMSQHPLSKMRSSGGTQTAPTFSNAFSVGLG